MERSVRVEGLDMEASAEDIRDFFARLHTTVGRVYILGGPQHEALIEFASGNDAQRAVHYSGRFLKGSKTSPDERRDPRTAPPPVADDVIQTSDKPGDPRTAPARSPTISSPPDHTEVLQTSDKPRDPKLYSHNAPNGSLQTFYKSNDPRTPPIVNAGPQMCDKPCDPRTTVASGYPQTCEESHEPRISSPIVPSDFLQTADKTPTPEVYKPFVPSLCPLRCDKPLYTAFSGPVESIQTSDESQARDPLRNAFLLGVCTVLESLQSYQSEQREVLPDLDRQEDSSAITPKTQVSMPGYVRLFGLPASTTKEDICSFFKGLKVEEVVVNMKLEHRHVCLVKFSRKQESVDALQFNNKYMGPICVEVRKATEMMWNLAIEECENAHAEKCERNSLTDLANRKHKLRSEDKCNPTKKPRLTGPSKEYIVKVCNLPLATTKTDLRRLFKCHEIARSKIQHLLDKNCNRTDTAFLIFNQKADYEYALTHDGLLVGSGHIEVSAISRGEMKEMQREKHWPKNTWKRTTHTGSEMLGKKLNPDTKTCLLVQNMPECMKESLIKKLAYKVATDDITILSDDGKASCTAMVQFKSLKLVSMACKLSQELLGESAIIKLITTTQMNNFANEGLH
ncbi:RNA binding motif protein 12Ba isoform X2 [Phyllopteryx taeniolatus]|uniref:RNA binding motif protein 12Ba isoform X2 n=1 Tax=Phyllopteryx taeniolatus TaxID=161469 RepID=UPI002AD1D988|nr:RNA binding motif protein 12Ba isoform X2 [Phyllopteryx taeniolatus]